MKKIKYLILSLFAVTAMTSCIDNDNDELTGGAATGGLVNVNNPLVSYVVGSGATYTATGSVQQGRIQTTSVEVYKSFTNNVTGAVSNEELLTTVTISDTAVGASVGFEVSFTYEDLIANLTVGGSGLPANDGSLNIGDFWQLKYVAKTSAGTSNANAKTTKVAVGTRYAGEYLVLESAYWNSGTFRGSWDGSRIIESVNASIYRHVGLAFWDDNEFFFTVDNDTNVISVLDVDLAGDALLLNGSPVMNCQGTGGYSFESIACNDTTSLATPDDVAGKDQLEFTVGYFRGIGATREFYEKLVRK